MRRDRLIARVATGVVAAIAAVLSWDATTAVAIHTHAAPRGLAWLVPGVIEAGVVALAVTAWTAAAAGRRARLETWTAAGLLMLSTVVQIARVVYDGGSWLGMVIAATIPGVLLVCAHGLLADVRRSGAARRATPAKRAQGERARSARTRATAGPAAARPVAVETATQVAPARTDRAQVIAHLAAERGGLDRVTGTMVSEALGVHPATGRRALARARQQADGALAA